jgi:gamma-butyrobetaine dioxygenase
VDEVLQLFASGGHGHFGEMVDQRRHALQSATLARSAGAPDHLMTAALLHGIGHLLSDTGVSPATQDDRQDAICASKADHWMPPLWPNPAPIPVPTMPRSCEHGTRRPKTRMPTSSTSTHS